MASLGFLSWFPATGLRRSTQREISDSRAYFPLVGLFIGLALVVLEAGFSRVVPVYLTAAVLVTFPIAATRGLHFDGLMDVCDGLFGGATPERRLEIMRDSRAGSFAVAGGVSIILLKYGALVSLLTLPGPEKIWTLALFPTVSRWAMVVALASFPYVRSRGLGSPFHQGDIWPATIVAAATALAIAMVVAGLGGVVIVLGITGLAWLAGRGMASMLGGLTGDTYGAINEISEAAALMAAVALIPHGLMDPLPSLLGAV
jgi:adenosylcobinamide-GDP ribazoletransferase